MFCGSLQLRHHFCLVLARNALRALCKYALRFCKPLFVNCRPDGRVAVHNKRGGREDVAVLEGAGSDGPAAAPGAARSYGPAAICDRGVVKVQTLSALCCLLRLNGAQELPPGLLADLIKILAETLTKVRRQSGTCHTCVVHFVL